jgi:hypothetical protein
LPREANSYRSQCAQQGQQILLDPMSVLDWGRWHRIDLAVNDTSAQGLLLEEALSRI